MKRDERDYVLLSKLLDEGLDRPREDRRRWLEQLPPAHAVLKPQLTRMLLTQLREEAKDLLPVVKLIRAALLDLAAFRQSMSSQRKTLAVAAGLLEATPRNLQEVDRATALAEAARAIGAHDELAVAMRQKLLVELIHQYQDILRDTFRKE
ncbi:MAG: hypothetical protein ABI769_00840 [Pseudomonadota bacterium]